MPDIWKMLEIEPTKDVAIIKRAYAYFCGTTCYGLLLQGMFK